MPESITKSKARIYRATTETLADSWSGTLFADAARRVAVSHDELVSGIKEVIARLDRGGRVPIARAMLGRLLNDLEDDN